MDSAPPPNNNRCCRIDFYQLYGLRNWSTKFGPGGGTTVVEQATLLVSTQLLCTGDEAPPQPGLGLAAAPQAAGDPPQAV